MSSASTVPWKVAMPEALNTGKDKLSAYYTKTEKTYGSLYAIGTILAPQHKLNFFSSELVYVQDC
ncbi:HAT dimerization [Penicillium maclennaniae]|uniref:HAT dimerization n=1 Tax=Penicillium maclennaniae TaxID=1343394 RepID=UPI002541B187|nr:HAT dimerization [Penicillium maclennaniae]KAJ5683808.1 HAT dimerization [Penicillium maclennaniae]